MLNRLGNILYHSSWGGLSVFVSSEGSKFPSGDMSIGALGVRTSVRGVWMSGSWSLDAGVLGGLDVSDDRGLDVSGSGSLDIGDSRGLGIGVRGGGDVFAGFDGGDVVEVGELW